MADLVAADLSYELQTQDIEDKYRENRIKITTAAGEYPTGGLPLTNAKLGMPNEVRSLVVLEGSTADIFSYDWDKSADKLVVLREVAGVIAEHTNSTFTSPDELVVLVKGW